MEEAMSGCHSTPLLWTDQRRKRQNVFDEDEKRKERGQRMGRKDLESDSDGDVLTEVKFMNQVHRSIPSDLFNLIS
ncbi:unnamed protein product [Fusarium graminearum]|uniref:Chromosome 2, complete genome n=2 Tax=Gibberella zeae TaxID=5518 RepID=A0A098DHE9_GIBZE|nr:unnamed protein product [Fusarium graminearum]CAF3500944.1 unnamed protein product [Fusarium graminearum]CAF3604903.1 unnamed protein product [Fusarium graminearum]CAG1965091.1 unnamed protein product [Fusarium graminearum]CAG1967227.1 unnamed protein product [Fusarium graminearum]